jgi:hypothetical protein
MTVGEIRFRFAEFDEELRVISELAQDFLTPDSVRVITELLGALDGIRAAAGSRMLPLEVADSRPIRSLPTNAFAGNAGVKAWAELTLEWLVRPLGNPSNRMREFEIAGAATSRVRLKWHEGDEVAMWRTEIAVGTGPGCHFHVQIRGQDAALPFPQSIPVPRLPATVVTPAAALEFALSELFQDDWRTEVERTTRYPQQRWRAIQKARMKRLLQWQLDLTDSAAISPLVAIKLAKPPAELFTA